MSPKDTQKPQAADEGKKVSSTSDSHGQETEPNKVKSAKGDFDPFYLNDLYPDPVAIFSFKPKTLKDVKDEAIVVLDTSALLLPYDSNSGSLAAIESVLTELAKKGRLAVPAQAAREFAGLRFRKLVELADQVEKKQKSLQDLQIDASSLLNALPEIEELKAKYNAINKHIGEARDLLKKAASTIREWYSSDPVSEIYRRIFTPEVVVEVKADRKELSRDNERRNTYDLPPGFGDKSKPDGGIGDKIIWRCILELGASKKTSLIYVTNDFKKGDLGHWNQEKLLFARYELIDEYRRESGGHTFHATQLSSVIELFTDNVEAVEDIRKSEQSQEANSIQPITSEQVLSGYKGLMDYSEGKDSAEGRAAAAAIRKMWKTPSGLTGHLTSSYGLIPSSNLPEFDVEEFLKHVGAYRSTSIGERPLHPSYLPIALSSRPMEPPLPQSTQPSSSPEDLDSETHENNG